MLCIVIPLGLVSLLGYAMMAALQIGLKVSTLPVVALGVGVGVDYGIYIYSRLKSFLAEGYALQDAYRLTLEITGNGDPRGMAVSRSHRREIVSPVHRIRLTSTRDPGRSFGACPLCFGELTD